MNRLDKTHVEILNLVQTHAHLSAKEIADKVHLTPSAVNYRIRFLESNNYILSYNAHLNKLKVNVKVTGITCIKLLQNNNEMINSFITKVSQTPAVINCYHIIGEYDFMVRLGAETKEEYLLAVCHLCGDTEGFIVKNCFILDEMNPMGVIDLNRLLKKKE